jgi:hypothetical protein
MTLPSVNKRQLVIEAGVDAGVIRVQLPPAGGLISCVALLDAAGLVSNDAEEAVDRKEAMTIHMRHKPTMAQAGALCLTVNRLGNRSLFAPAAFNLTNRFFGVSSIMRLPDCTIL